MRALRELAGRVGDRIPLRSSGWVLLVLALAALWFADDNADYVLHAASLAALGLLGLCALFSSLGALALWRSVRKLPSGLPDELETTRTVRTRFRFRRMIAWPLVEARMHWQAPAGVDVDCVVAGAWYEESITAHERGRRDHVVRRFAVEDIFGLTGVAFRVRYACTLALVPARSAAGVEVAVGYATGDAFSHPSGRTEGDLVEMRRYGYGDPLRHVLWKTFARTRHLLVRMPERAVSPMPASSAFLIAGEGDEPAAAAARLYVETGLLGADFVFGADGGDRPVDKPAEAVAQIVDSIGARADGGSGLDAFRRAVDPTRLGRCIVFAPPIDGKWRERLVGFAQTLPVPATVIIGVDGEKPTAKPGRLARWLVQPPSARQVLPDVARVRAGLEAAGLSVVVLHRTSGQVL
jgi:hypothetical protein